MPSIGEFHEVGNTVKSMAADDANVVMGTVIDNDMGGDLRVTLVATGLGPRVAVQQKPAAVKLVEKRASGEVDYGKLERPTVMRNEARAANKLDQDYDLEYLDIPAFLRRQAD